MAQEEKTYYDERTGRTYTMSWTHPHIELRREGVKHGRGLVTVAPIKAGEDVWRESSKEENYLFTEEDISTWSEEEQRTFHITAYVVAPGTWSGTPPWVDTAVFDDISEYWNHSCDPNTWFVDNSTKRMTARRDIPVGEEITYDYATSETEESQHKFECNCGSKECRGPFDGSAYRRVEVREKYRGHFTDHVLKKIQEQGLE